METTKDAKVEPVDMKLEIVVLGVYEYSGSEQWLRYAEVPTLPAPFWLRNSNLTRHDASFDPLIEGLAEQAADPTERVAVLHEVMKRVGERVAYKTGASTVETTAQSRNHDQSRPARASLD